MHEMHNNSLCNGHMKAIDNTFFFFFENYVAILILLYYNGKDFNAKLLIMNKGRCEFYGVNIIKKSTGSEAFFNLSDYGKGEGINE